MPYVDKRYGALIVGTVEIVEATYPITRGDDGTWTYTGGESRFFDDGAIIKKNAAGEDLFLREDGEETPESQLEWRDEE